MFLLDTSSIILLRSKNKCFSYPYFTTSRVIKELNQKNIKYMDIGPYFLIMEIIGTKIRTADEEIVIISQLCPKVKVVSEDYNLRRKTTGISIKKLLYNQ